MPVSENASEVTCGRDANTTDMHARKLTVCLRTCGQ